VRRALLADQQAQGHQAQYVRRLEHGMQKTALEAVQTFDDRVCMRGISKTEGNECCA
jgi:hypothetical protein